MSPRVYVFVAAGVAALISLAVAAAAPGAGTAYDPQLNVTAPTAGGGYAINAQIKSATTVETGRLSLFAPANFSATFPAAGSEAGGASVRLQLADRGDAYVNLTGKVVVANGDKLGCVAHTTAADASFAINLSGGGITMSIPMAAYKITGDRTKYSSYEFSQCFPPAGVPKGTAGRRARRSPLDQRDADNPGSGRAEEREQLLDVRLDAVHRRQLTSRRRSQRRGASGHRRAALPPACEDDREDDDEERQEGEEDLRDAVRAHHSRPTRRGQGAGKRLLRLKAGPPCLHPLADD